MSRWPKWTFRIFWLVVMSLVVAFSLVFLAPDDPRTRALPLLGTFLVGSAYAVAGKPISNLWIAIAFGTPFMVAFWLVLSDSSVLGDLAGGFVSGALITVVVLSFRELPTVGSWWDLRERFGMNPRPPPETTWHRRLDLVVRIVMGLVVCAAAIALTPIFAGDAQGHVVISFLISELAVAFLVVYFLDRFRGLKSRFDQRSAEWSMAALGVIVVLSHILLSRQAGEPVGPWLVSAAALAVGARILWLVFRDRRTW